jgi:hypothetical protein
MSDSAAGRDGATDPMLEITYADLSHGRRPRGDVLVVGGGVVRGADLSGWEASWLSFTDATGLLSEMLPRPLKPGRVGREIPLFVDCDFSGLRCRAFEPGIARFVRCTFVDVDVKANVGATAAHFEGCRFSGVWEGNFDARPANHDPARRVRVSGNDFTGCGAFSMQGGVGRDDNTFDTALHVVLERGGPGWASVQRMAEEDLHLRHVVTSLQGQGPFHLGQDWAVVDQGDWPDDLWQRLRSVTSR